MNNYEFSLERVSYDFMVLENLIESYKTERVISEAILLNEGASFNQIQAIHEGVGEKIKNIFLKIVAKIKELWARFLEAGNALFATDQDYLKKYKDIILKKPPTNGAYTTYRYWVGTPNLLSLEVPRFNFNQLKADLVDDNTFIKKYFNHIYDEKGNYKDKAKSLFRGGDSEYTVEAKSVEMEKLYTYCMDYPNMINKLKKDMDYINECGSYAIKIFTNTKVTPQVTGKNETVMYSYLNNSVITEIKKVEGDPGAGNNNNQQQQPKPSEQMKNVSTNNAAPDTKEELQNAATNMDEDIKLCQRYMSICTSILTAKMSILEEAYKAYMYIIRDHVKAYVGKEDVKNKPAEGDQNNNNNDQTNSNDKNAKNNPPAEDDKKLKDENKSLLKKIGGEIVNKIKNTVTNKNAKK